MNRWTWMKSAALIVGLAMSAAACGDADDGASSGQQNSEAASADLKEFVDATYDFPYPETPVDLGEHRIAYISAGSASSQQPVDVHMEAAIEETGWELVGGIGDGQFTPTVQGKLVQQAVLNKVDAIIVHGVFPSTIPGPFEAVVDAGIPYVCILCLPDDTEGVIYVDSDPVEQGKDIVPFVLAALQKPDATIAVIRDDEFISIKAQSDAHVQTIKEQCPDCEVVEVPILVSDLAKPVIPAFQNLLQEYPAGQLDAVIGPFNSAVQPLAQLAKQQGRSDFKIFGSSGTPPWSTQVKGGVDFPLIYADQLLSQTFFNLAGIDQAARAMAGEPAWDATKVPTAPVIQENAAELIGDDGFWSPEGMTDKFNELWGLS